MTVEAEVIRLSWQNARMLALIMNAIAGLLGHFDGANVADPDTLLGIRMAQHMMSELVVKLHGGNELDAKIIANVRNMSEYAEKIMATGQRRYRQFDDFEYQQFEFLLDYFRFPLQPYRRLDERWRWVSKELDDSTTTLLWLSNKDKGGYTNCIKQARNCQLTEQCKELLTSGNGKPSVEVTKQLIALAALVSKSCDKQIDELLRLQPPSPKIRPGSISDLTLELCTNVHDDVSKFKKDKKNIRIDGGHVVEQMAQEVFACGLFGFVDFVDLTVLETLLTWQHPKKGCYTMLRPDPLPKHGLREPSDQFGSDLKQASRKEEACLAHRSAAVLCALTIALRVVLDAPPWPETRLDVDSALQPRLLQIPAEERFAAPRYVDWVRDAHFPDRYRMPRPPPHAWSPDLVAFVLLAFFFVGLAVVAHHTFSARNLPAGVGPTPHTFKQYYHYAYKKL